MSLQKIARGAYHDILGIKSPKKSEKTNSAIPLPPGVGLTSNMIHMLSCLPNIKK